MAARVSLFLFVVALGIDLGAGLYETRNVAPVWRRALVDHDAVASAFLESAPNAGPRFWVVLTPSVALLALLALVTGLHTSAPQRFWRLLATVVELAVVTSTFAYFVPNIIVLLGPRHATLAPDVLAARLHTWLTLNWVRVGLTAVAWLAALRALSLSGS